MAKVINAVRARATLVSILTTLSVILVNTGKWTQEDANLVLENAGWLWDVALSVISVVALMVPSILKIFSKDKEEGKVISNE